MANAFSAATSRAIRLVAKRQYFNRRLQKSLYTGRREAQAVSRLLAPRRLCSALARQPAWVGMIYKPVVGTTVRYLFLTPHHVHLHMWHPNAPPGAGQIRAFWRRCGLKTPHLHAPARLMPFLYHVTLHGEGKAMEASCRAGAVAASAGIRYQMTRNAKFVSSYDASDDDLPEIISVRLLS